MTRTPINRFQASAIHVALSATVATVVFLVIYLLWYPGVLFDAGGGKELSLLILAVDVTIGPLVTLIIFVPGKKGLLFDLWVIGLLQAAFLTYGVWAVAESRPVYIAFVKDRFELARASQIPDSVLEDARMSRSELSWTGPKIVGVRFPADPDRKFNLMISGMGGVDIQSYPQYHVPYDSVRKDVVEHSVALANLAPFNKGLSTADLARGLGRDQAHVRYLPLRAGKVDLTVLIDARTAEILRIEALKPWEYE